MKIGYDAKRAFLNRSGLGNYSRSLINALSTNFPGNEYVLYTPKTGEETPHLDKGLKTVLPSSLLDKKLKAIWRSYRLPDQLKKDGINLYHGLSHELPFGIKKTGIKTVVTIHDLIFLRYPRLYSLIDRNIYLKKIKYSCNVADKIVCISEQTKKDLISFLQVDPEKIIVIYQNCDQQFKEDVTSDKKLKVQQTYNLPDRYILHVGTVEERKNALTLVKAYQTAKNTDFHLVIVGKHTSYAEKVKAEINSKNKDRIHFLPNVQFEDLPAIYQQAELFIYPSFFEGFGIPIIEAQYSKVPVISSLGSCFSEAGGPHSTYIDPNSVQELTNTIEKLMENGETRRKIGDLGYEYVQKFNDIKMANDLMELYNSLQQ